MKARNVSDEGGTFTHDSYGRVRLIYLIFSLFASHYPKPLACAATEVPRFG